MDSTEAQNQIQQMMNFILNEAKDKAEEINTKGLEEFSIERFRIVNQQKEKIRQEYAKKAKQVETSCAIARSTAINKARLEKIKARSEVLDKVSGDVKSNLVSAAKDKKFVQDLITQGLLMLLEDEVAVTCRKEDEALVKSVLDGAAQSYSDVIKKQSGATKKCKLSLTSENLPAGSMGGVVLGCQNGSIKIDNTVDVRLRLVMEQDKPKIRSLLFPGK
mmetsp:Transcript_26126/g.60923  ORF Transcript_26126/g.60923 Transcript_26126/m.60923 type:complete len:219 (-) Transcript_26126:175-831(-)|eukprot:CAMPEP_0178428740 /NCGR_PEP_ID=MMETSP0689_2-20121128/30439_1 /TAXON_ID=160604 /ORGANISM="Amphidinium massartii, Strain CS-259" /LENGTH=218 /DNA_ID=CAMNT_0020050533 /DNA_START=115 /DNA_END=771 /DNA_ORIENTATION=+